MGPSPAWGALERLAAIVATWGALDVQQGPAVDLEGLGAAGAPGGHRGHLGEPWTCCGGRRSIWRPWGPLGRSEGRALVAILGRGSGRARSVKESGEKRPLFPCAVRRGEGGFICCV